MTDLPAAAAPASRESEPRSQSERLLLRKVIEFCVLTLLLSVVLNLVGSWFWWQYLLTWHRPEVEISGCVLKGPHRTEPSKTVYRIRIVNGTNRQVNDLTASAHIARRVGGTRTAIQETLTFRIDESNLLSRVLSGRNAYGKDVYELRPVFTFVIEGQNLDPSSTVGAGERA